MSNFARGSYHGLSYVTETTAGTTPGSPTMRAFRYTTVGLALSKTSFQSNEIRSDRQIADLRHGVKQTGGPIGFELTYTTGIFDFFSAALFGTWTTAASPVLKAGTTAKSFTIERRFTGLATPQYHVFTGQYVNQLDLTLPTDGMVTGSFGMMGMDFSTSTTTLGAPAAENSNSPFDSFSGSFTEGGTANGVITEVRLTVNNNMQHVFVIGSNSAAAVLDGRCNVTGSVSAYFQDSTLFNKWLNETETSLNVSLQDPDGNAFALFMPRVKYSGGDNPVNDEGPIVMNMPFQALYDSTTGTALQITRTDAS